MTWVLLCFLSFFGLIRDAKATGFTPGSTTFPSVPVGQTSAPVLITLTVQGSGAPASTLAMTEGVNTANLAEFTVTDPGTCGSSPNLAPPQTCTVQATFTPRFPGVRHGAVLVETSSGTLLASQLLSGVGLGSLPVLIPGQITTIAGNGDHFFEGDNVHATGTSLYLPAGIAVDGAGNLYVADTTNNRVRRVDAAAPHNITTVAGDGNAGSIGDGGPATAAEITGPSGLALDGAGNLYIADTGNHAIRRVDAVTGLITTVAGTLGQANYTGNAGPAIGATLNAPQGIALTPAGDLIIADTGNAVIRAVTKSDGYIQTIAGTGTPGFNGDGLATSTQLNSPSSIALRSDGVIAIADLNNNRVRLLTLAGTISTVAGNGTPGYSGDGGNATQAELQRPSAVVFDPAGDLLIADDLNDCIRFVSGSDGTISTLAGNPADDRYAGDGGPDNAARMHGPDGLFFDAAGNLWISDSFNNRVREVYGAQLAVGPYPTMKVGKKSQPVSEQMLNAGNQPLILTTPVQLQQAALDSGTTTCGQSAIASSALCAMGLEFAPTQISSSLQPTIDGYVNWHSNAPNILPIDHLYGEVLSVEPTSVVINPTTSNQNPGILGQPVSLTATVTSDDTGRTGTVDFVEGSYTWCSAVPLAANGTAACQIPSLALGNHNFVANYSGDNNNAASQSVVFVETIKQQPALALSISTSPATVTSNVILGISSADANGGTPTGTVVFYDGTTPLATVTLDANGNASWGTANLAVGTHSISAQYAGDASNVPVSTPAAALVITQANTVTVLNSSNNDATVGAPITLTGNVVTHNGPVPTGSVQFLDGSAVLGSGPVANGSASLTVTSLAPGSHNLTAVYSGDTDNGMSTSAAMLQKVEQIGTQTTLGADVDPANAGATITFTAIVAMAPGTTADGALAGTVTFHDGSVVLGSSPINATGQAMLPVKSLSVGPHPIVATYNGSTNYATSNSTPLSETVQQTPTAVTLGSASSLTLMGKTATFTAAVTSATGSPTGTITFKDGAGVLGTSTLDAHGSASFSTSTLSAGNHAITANYSGDSNYLAASSPVVQQTVSLAQTALLLSGPSTPVDAGTPAHFAAALSSPGIAPTGSILLLDGAAVIGTQPVSSAGSFSFTTSALAVGTHTLTAAYGGDANNVAANSSSITVLVRQATTVTALASSANPLTQGDALTLTASISTDSPNAGGEVTFLDGNTSLGKVSVVPNGAATLTIQNLSLGNHSITVAYSGDTNHAASTSVTLPELVVQRSSLTLTSSVNPSISGKAVLFTGQITGYPAPTGSATFRDNGTVLGTVQLNAVGVAALETSTLSVGTHTISFIYSGDTNFSTSTAQITQTVLNATTHTTLSATANPTTYGASLGLSASVSSNGGAATGKVIFSDGNLAIGSAVVDANGVAVLTTTALSPGTHTITATYLGDGKASPSTSLPLSSVVKQTTTLAVSSDANPTFTLTPVSLTATLTNGGAAPASGSVSFLDGTTVLGSASLDSAGHASLSIPQMTAGSHNLTAAYEGDGANFASTSPVYAQTVRLRATSTTVTGTATDPSNPQQMTLIAVVRGGGSVPPSGTVNFTAGNITLGAAVVDSTGVASITVIFNTPTQQIVATYPGDLSYAASQSATTPITAGQPAQFTVTVGAPTITLVSHQHASVSVTVASVKGFTDTIALGCLGLPYAATCTFDNSQLKLAADGTVTANLVIDTGDPLGAGSGTSASLRGVGGVFSCLLPAALLLAGLSRRGRRPRLTRLFICLWCISAIGLTGCSGLQMSGTPPGTYTIRVIGTGRGSNTTEAQTVTLVVTQ